jgi:hypothetical protein
VADQETYGGEDGIDRGLDKLASRIPNDKQAALGSVGEHLVPMGGRMAGEMDQIASDLGVEADLDHKMLETVDETVRELPSPVAAGVDLSAIKAVEPQFDAENFRLIARETFAKVRDSRWRQDKREGDALLSAAMQNDLNNAIDGDVASHRHHVLAELNIEEATIVSAAVEGGRERIGVHLTVTAAENERNDADLSLASGTTDEHRWTEKWMFERDPSVDTSASDEAHILCFDDEEWMVAHRGWVVTSIERLNEAVAQPRS